MNRFAPLLNSTAVLLFAAFLFSGCAHHRDVRASADGVHWVNIKAETEEDGMQDALSQANHFCEKRNKTAGIVSENKTYTGQMDERQYKKVKTAGKVAQTVGGSAYVFGGETESELGSMVGLGGTVANQIAGEGYSVKVKFKCI